MGARCFARACAARRSGLRRTAADQLQMPFLSIALRAFCCAESFNRRLDRLCRDGDVLLSFVLDRVADEREHAYMFFVRNAARLIALLVIHVVNFQILFARDAPASANLGQPDHLPHRAGHDFIIALKLISLIK